jgi:pimeloyl-ACP methyl ester carboxylesterase
MPRERPGADRTKSRGAQDRAPGGWTAGRRRQAYVSDAALTAGFGFYRAFAQDAADNRAATGEITGTPMLYVRGAASRGNIDSYARGLRAAGIRQVATALVPDAGHFVAEEQPAPLWRLMREFITSGPAANLRPTGSLDC